MNRKLDNWIDSYLRFTKHHEASEKYHRWTAYALISAAVNRNCWMDAGYYKIFPNLYILFVGPSGIGKSTSSGLGVELLRETSLKINIYKDSITAPALLTFMSKSVVNMEFQHDGRTIIAKKTPLLLYASELGNLLSLRTGIRELTLLLTELFNKQGDHEDTTNTRGTIRIKKPCITFFACCFPSWIEEELTTTSLRSGFLGRMLVVHSLAKRHLQPNIVLTEEEHQLRADLLYDLEVIGALYGQIRWSLEALRVWTKWYHDQPKDFSEAASRGLEVEGFVARKPHYVQRVAILNAIARSSFSKMVELSDLQKSFELVNACERDIGMIGFTTEDYKIAVRVFNNLVRLTELRNVDTIGLGDLMQRVSKWCNKRQLDACLEHLSIIGKIDLVGRKIKVLSKHPLGDIV